MSIKGFVDAVIVLMFSLAVWGSWFRPLVAIEQFKRERWPVTALLLTWLCCAIGLASAIAWLAAPDVRESADAVTMYLLLGLLWLRVGELLFAFAGVSARDDAVERRNSAAVAAVAGAFVGMTLCFAGGNVGAGPGWIAVVFSAGLATSSFFIAWMTLNLISDSSEAVTIERDVAAGLRLGSWLAAVGLILGNSVAGPWTSAGATVLDFAREAWVLVPFAGAAAAIDRISRPTVDRPHPSVWTHGIAPSATYIAAAGVYVARLPWPT